MPIVELLGRRKVAEFFWEQSFMKASVDSASNHPLQCMEIWGGSHAVDSTVSTPGIDAWIFSKPFEEATSGGDVHYVSLCGGGVITRMIVADVSGHGQAVSELAQALRLLMRRNINNKSQTRLVRALNREFAALSEMGRFATAVVATYLASHRRLTVCNAGHPRPLWYQAADRSWSVLTAELGEADGDVTNLPLGLDEATRYEQFSVTLSPGDAVLFYTDALVEATTGEKRLLGEEGLLELVKGLAVTDPRTLGTALLSGVAQYRGNEPSDDDLTLLAIYHNANPSPRLSLGQKIDVYAKVFGLKTV
jgi:phosphoserine phosphatase RsbU/P